MYPSLVGDSASVELVEVELMVVLEFAVGGLYIWVLRRVGIFCKFGCLGYNKTGTFFWRAGQWLSGGDMYVV